jgi:hypothetical protein
MIERVKRRLRGEGGTTIVEMLTVMIIMSIVFAGITSVFVAGSKAAADRTALPGPADDPVGTRQDPPRHPLRHRRHAVYDECRDVENSDRLRR